MMDPAMTLTDLAGLYREKNAEYGENWKNVGPILAGLFPEGLELETAQDFLRFHLLMLVVVKLSRYAANWDQGHADSLRDAAVYLAMLGAADSQ